MEEERFLAHERHVVYVDAKFGGKLHEWKGRFEDVVDCRVRWRSFAFGQVAGFWCREAGSNWRVQRTGARRRTLWYCIAGRIACARSLRSVIMRLNLVC